MLKVSDYVEAKGYIGDKWINGKIKRIQKGDVGIVMKLGDDELNPSVYVFWCSGELQNEELEVLENQLNKIYEEKWYKRITDISGE